MKRIFVTVKRVPDYESKVRLTADGSAIDTATTKWVLNPFDEIAVEEAVRIKEHQSDIEVVVASIGPAAAAEQVRNALAIGADRGILVVTDAPIDSDCASRVFQKLLEQESYDLIIMGKQAVDSDANQTGQLLAARKQLPQATFASKVVIADDWSAATVTCEVDGGLKTIKVKLPAVITTDLRLNVPRYPSLPNIVKAKKKPLQEVLLAELGVDSSPKVTVRSYQMPKGRGAGVKVASVEELVDKLQNEAKVL